jgi:AraC-like DNA-binding protein
MQGFDTLVAELGGQPANILSRAGLAADILSRPDEWIPFRSVLIAYELAALATNCKNFGLLLAMHRDLSFLGPLVLIFKYSSDLEQGLQSCTQYMRAHSTGYTPILEVKGPTASYQLRMDPRHRAHANQWVEESLLTATKLVRIILGESYTPKAVYCRHAQTADTNYEHFFGINLRFRAPYDGIRLDREDLKSLNPIDDQQVHQVLLKYLDSRVLRAADDLPAAARALLLKLIPTGKFSVDVLADQLCVHRRTLQRRLKASDLTYADLLDECRSEMAKEYLLINNLPMGNLAQLLGYADQSAFNHAFRRWHAMTPRQWSSQGGE